MIEAARVLKSDGLLIVCDADFSKAALGNFPDDPLDACAKLFVKEFVTDPHIVAKLGTLLSDVGFVVGDFEFQSRTILDNDQMLPWVEETGKVLIKRGEISQALHDGLVAEYGHWARERRLYGYHVFVTVLARKP